MTKVLVTGSNGFVGRNLCIELARREGVELFQYDIENRPDELDQALAVVDVIFHLAGVNRPQNVEEYQTGNAGFTGEICQKLIEKGRKPKIVLSSSIQAEQDNPYGVSKRDAEEAVRRYSQETGAIGVIFRLKNLFGKWCRPNYNSVTATFCYNIARDLPIQISNPANVVDLTYIDDLVAAFLKELNSSADHVASVASWREFCPSVAFHPDNAWRVSRPNPVLSRSSQNIAAARFLQSFCSSDVFDISLVSGAG